MYWAWLSPRAPDSIDWPATSPQPKLMVTVMDVALEKQEYACLRLISGPGVGKSSAVREAAAFTLIALGSPIQEMLAYAIWLQPGSTGCGLCIGAALEFLSGAKRRAPVWMQRAGMEWIFRLAQ